MTDVASIRRLREFIDERWVAVQQSSPRFRDCGQLRVRLEEVSPREAAWFLEALVPHGDEPPLFMVEDNNKHPSARIPPNAGGLPRGNVFFEKPGDYGALRLETIVHQAATWRLHSEFGWPLSHLIVESPDITDEHWSPLLRREALDVLLLETACPQLPSKMTIRAARSRVGVEVKADETSLARLLHAMRACQEGLVSADDPRHRIDHKKCNALDVLQPRFFLGVAADETWRLFPVLDRGQRAVFGDELPRLDDIRFKCK